MIKVSGRTSLTERELLEGTKAGRKPLSQVPGQLPLCPPSLPPSLEALYQKRSSEQPRPRTTHCQEAEVRKEGFLTPFALCSFLRDSQICSVPRRAAVVLASGNTSGPSPVPHLCRGRQGMCSCSNPFPGLEVKGHPLLTKLS